MFGFVPTMLMDGVDFFFIAIALCTVKGIFTNWHNMIYPSNEIRRVNGNINYVSLRCQDSYPALYM